MGEKVEQIPNTSAILGEGSLWHSKQGLLYWVDILGHKLHTYNPATHESKEFQLDQMVGTVVPRKSGGAMLGLHEGFASFDFETGKYSLIHNPETDPITRFNDGKCDPQGRFWAGTMAVDPSGPPKGSLYFMDSLQNVHKKLGDVGISNGICWSSDHKTMYYIDTHIKAVDSFDFDSATGHISNRKKIITIPEGCGHPDGMTIDSDGNLWVAHWGGGRVTQWNPHTGELLRTVTIPTPKVTSVAFGGPHLEDLYVTTASEGGAPPPAGALFRVTGLGVKGLPAYEFDG